MASTALIRTREQLTKARKSASRARQEARKPAGAIIANMLGSAGAGAVRVYVPGEVMGVPTEVGIGVAAILLGYSQGNPSIAFAGAGMVGPFIADSVENALS